VKYFFDNCISPKIAKMLCALDVDAESLRERFPVNIKDVQLFQNLHGQQLAFISTDTSQLTRENEARALKQAGVTVLHFGPFFERMQLWDQAVWIVRRWPLINGFASGVAMGTAAEIKQNGRARIHTL
jgi:hypothetical protein